MRSMKTPFLILMLITATAATAFAVGRTLMSVQVRTGHVRSTPSFLGKVVGSLAYGDRVATYERQGPWSQVDLPGSGSKGWMHVSALTKKRIVINPDAADVERAASGSELALAGKGFNNEVEKKYRAKHTDVDYAWVDRMEKMVVSPKNIKRFVQDGGLTPQGGAQ